MLTGPLQLFGHVKIETEIDFSGTLQTDDDLLLRCRSKYEAVGSDVCPRLIAGTRQNFSFVAVSKSKTAFYLK